MLSDFRHAKFVQLQGGYKLYFGNDARHRMLTKRNAPHFSFLREQRANANKQSASASKASKPEVPKPEVTTAEAKAALSKTVGEQEYKRLAEFNKQKVTETRVNLEKLEAKQFRLETEAKLEKNKEQLCESSQ